MRRRLVECGGVRHAHVGVGSTCLLRFTFAVDLRLKNWACLLAHGTGERCCWHLFFLIVADILDACLMNLIDLQVLCCKLDTGGWLLGWLTGILLKSLIPHPWFIPQALQALRLGSLRKDFSIPADRVKGITHPPSIQLVFAVLASELSLVLNQGVPGSRA